MGRHPVDRRPRLAAEHQPGNGGDGSSAAFAQIQGLAFSNSGVLYGATQSLYTINTTTGAMTPVGAGGLGDVRGIEFVNQGPPSVSFVPANGHVSPAAC